jgi:hypothetical protein
MSNLTYEELILLDNLIYLKWNVKEDEKLISIVDDLLKNQNFHFPIDMVGSCMIRMTTNEWINILEQIKNKPNLSTLRIKNVDSYNDGMKYACFIDEDDNAIVVFRGTTTMEEWEDNGQGAYEYDTQEQIEALNFINSLNYNNITITGHSKGGNKAQYVTIFSSKIAKCISVNGQGFSKEFIGKYEEDINKNKLKIVSINAKYDYVNCLFNSIAGKDHFIETEIQINPFDYHKAIILLDGYGKLRQEANEAEFSKVINYFSLSIISNLPKDLKYLVINGVIDVIELILCRNGAEGSLFKILGEHLIMLCHENCFNYKELFSVGYAVSEILILPLLFWNDLVYIEETNSKELLRIVITNIKILGDRSIKKLEIINKDQIDLIESISNIINELTYKLEDSIE